MLISKTAKVKWSYKNKKYYESLGYKFTKISDEFEVKVEDLTDGSGATVVYCCDDCGIEKSSYYKDYLRAINKQGLYYCQKCSHKHIDKKHNYINKERTLYGWCIEHNRQDMLDRWDYELNKCSPKDIYYGTGGKYYFKCNNHPEHKSELKALAGLTREEHINIFCNQCNSIAQWFIDNNLDINDYWDFEKNTINPWDISYGNSSKKCWFKCTEKDYHGSYKMTCNNFTSNKQRCPYCNNRNGKIHTKDSLGQHIIDNYGEEFLWSIWSDKNKKTPFEYAPKSNIEVWWKCMGGEHEDFKRSVASSTFCEFRCPKCVEEMNNSIIEEKTKIYLEELGYEVLTEHKCTIRPINPKTKMPMPFDNEITLENGKHLIIEVHGGQHYKEVTGYHKNKLHQRKLYDRYKRIKCKQAGYEYLEIPYTAFEGENKEQYKQMIDDKIKEILNISKTS